MLDSASYQVNPNNSRFTHLALAPVRTVAPTLHLWSLDEVKAHLRVDGTDDDELIEALRDAITDHLDGFTGILGRCLLPQTWRQDLPYFPGEDRIRLPLAPVSAVTGITYRDTDNALQTLSTAVYAGPFNDTLGPYIILQWGQVWPSTYPREDAVAITFTAGYATLDAVPKGIRQAALLMIGDLMENRETVMTDLRAASVSIPMSATVDALLSNHRRVGI